MRVPILVATIVLGFISAAGAQSLADVARQEGQRRQTTKPAGKTYTNTDLKPVRAPEASADAAAPAADAAPDAAGAAEPKAEPDAAAGQPTEKVAAGDSTKAEVKDQAYWAKRQAALREQLTRDETYLEALQSRINALTFEFVNRDDPIQRDQIERDRNRSLAELDRLQKSVESDRKAIADFEEEARRAGVPPGWLR